MTREEEREERRRQYRQDDINYKLSNIDTKQICFRNALAEVCRGINTVRGAYRNASPELERAISALEEAYANVVDAEKESRHENATIDDYVRFIRPDYVSVDNGHGNTPGNTPVTSVKVEVDVDGVHMYVNI